MKNLLIVISSKNPTKSLINTIESIYKIQLSDCNIINDNIKICIVDSDSSDFSIYDKISIIYPDIDICFAKNKHYEYGAWKYAYLKYPNYEKYFCIQDTITILNKIDIDKVNDNTALTIFYRSGFQNDLRIYNTGINLLNNSTITFDDYKDIINTRFILSTHCSFIVTNKIICDIFKTLTEPPINKDGSITYERLFGLYFIIKKINTINIRDFIHKIHGKRI
jgi:hypothetical protein